MNLEIVSGDAPSMPLSLANHPFPIQRRRPQTLGGTPPRKRLESSHFPKRQGDISAVANDVNEQSLRDFPLNTLDIEDVLGIVGCPACHILLSGDCFHDNADEVPTRTAVAKYLFR